MSARETSAATFAGLTDLAASVLGGRVLYATDDFFADKDNLLLPGRGVFLADEYTDRGKWMDGWESRRKRVPGHDWCIIELGVPGLVRGVDIDTNHFVGNYPPYASLDACSAAPGTSLPALKGEIAWTEILTEVPLCGGTQNVFAVEPGVFTHVRLHMVPDGGIARLRVWGEPRPHAPRAGELVDLACATRGGHPVVCSDMFFSPMANLVLPARATGMGGGWETRRRRSPGHDWIVVALGAPGQIERIEIDTAFFKGNFPDRSSVDGICWPNAPLSLLLASDAWERVLGEAKIHADRVHVFEQLERRGPFTHVRLNVLPCGGVSRLRVWGRGAEPDGSSDALLAKLNRMAPELATSSLLRCCGARRWARAMTARRPFVSRAELFGTAEHVWWRLDEGDWREAFSHHPAIGADVAKLRERFSATAEWSEGEQAGVSATSEETLARLAAGNARYLERLGYTFIVCATGKSAAQMLELLEARIDNAPDSEIRIAAGEQAKITALRLAKLEEA